MPSTQDFSPEAGAGGANTSVDGVAEHDIIPGDTWANLWGAAGSSHSDTANSFGLLLLSKNTSNVWRAIDRDIATIDLSSFAYGSSSITGATFKIYAYQFSGSMSTFFTDISLVGATPTNPADLANGDYAQLGVAKYAPDVDISSKSAGYYTFNLDATGITAVKNAVDGDGILKLGIRSKPDAENTAPTWADSVTASVDFYSADYGSNAPTLTITYETNITIAPPLLTLNIEAKVPTLKVDYSVPLITINIQALNPTIDITGTVFTNLTKHAASPTNVSKNSISPTNVSKNSATFTNQLKN